MTTRPDRQTACGVGADVPACDTGPLGRLQFVARELRGLLRRRDTPEQPRNADR